MGSSWEAEGDGEKRGKADLHRGSSMVYLWRVMGHRLGTKGCCALASPKHVLRAHLPSLAEQINAQAPNPSAARDCPAVQLGGDCFLEDRMAFTTY